MRAPTSPCTRIALALLAALVVAPPSARAEATSTKAKPQTKRVQAVGEWAYKRLNASHDAIAERKYDVALQTLDQIKGKPRLNRHEQALMWQTYGFVYGTQGKYQEATEAFQKALEADALPEATQLNVQFNVAQLLVALQRFPEAVEVLKQWFAKTDDPSPGAHYVYAVALYQSGDDAGALEHALAAVEKAPAPKEAWLQLALAVYLKSKRWSDAAGVLQTLIAQHPRPPYWLQLSAVYGELEDYETALAVMALAHEQGMLTTERELTHLAQLYLFNRIPYQATRVLEQAMADGKIQGTAASWQLLADALLAARERGKAEKPLEQAAAQAATGDLYLRLARVQIENDDWDAASKSLARAVEKGHLQDAGDAHLLLGIANARDAKWTEARRAFEVASRYEKTEKAAKDWLVEVETELKQKEGPLPAPAGQTARIGQGGSQ